MYVKKEVILIFAEPFLAVEKAVEGKMEAREQGLPCRHHCLPWPLY